MSAVSESTVRLFKYYEITINNGHYVCPFCGCEFSAKRSKRQWIEHVQQFHSTEFDHIVEGLQIINKAAKSIKEDSNEERMIDETPYVLLDEDELIKEQKV